MTENFEQTAYEEIKIFKQTYTLPVLGGESFNALQGNIQQRQEIIKTGKRPERVFLWVKSNKEIGFEERFVELDRLVVEVISKGIDKLVDDQNTQRRILDQMVQDLDDYREVYKLKKSMDQTRKRAAELVQLAVDLEQILNPVLGQFQGLIDQIVRIDGELNSTVSQVQDLVQNLTGSEGFFNFEGHNQVSDKLLDFLVINEQKKAVLSNALDEAQAKTTDFLLTNYQLLDECVEIYKL